ncbi:MAG: S46 family peptidase [Pirellulales bacterium]|nr:S46 family peptidase [Pirellulales bacterium]
MASLLMPTTFLLSHAPRLSADEGMWLFTNPPLATLRERYDFSPSAEWLSHLRQSAVRFNSGGSGSFVSPRGLVMTNHHVGADALAKLSSPEHDYLNDGFHARSLDQEIKCLDLELNVLVKIEDVTPQVMAAVKDGMSSADAEKARRAAMNTIEQSAKEKTGLRSDVVTLYQGGEYHLYSYKQYTDVRLVFAPEHKIAFFGGDPDNFEFPRYDLDICFFRAYENGQPAQVPHHLTWSAHGAAENELVFVAGHPGKTDRQNTVAHLEFMRDWTFPWQLNLLKRREVLLKNYSDRNAENALQAQDELFGIQNSRKARLGGLAGLQDPAVMQAKVAAENHLRATLKNDPSQSENAAAWTEIADGLAGIKPIYFELLLLERAEAFDSRYFDIARDLVRLAIEREKPNAERLREYRESALDSLKQELFSAAPLYEALEIAKLADSLGLYQEMQAGDGWAVQPDSATSQRRHELLAQVLAGKSPRERAAELIRGSKLRDIAYRQELFDGGLAAIKASEDPMIKLALLVDPAAREVRKTMESVLEEPLRQAYAKIAKARFATAGTSVYPDATFTLRLAFGTVRGFTEPDGTVVPPWTTLGGAFEHAQKHDNKYPFQLPESWIKAKDRLRLDTPFNFISTADIIGGNSGSPVVNRAGEIVGIIFDGNIQSLVLDFAYSDTQARAVSVHSAGIIEALDKVYDARELVEELRKGK